MERGVAIEQVSSLHRIVPVELEQRAMELIRSSACNDIDLTTGAFSEFGAVIARLDLELFDRVDRRPDHQKILVLIGVHGSIQEKAVLFRPHAADRNASTSRAAVIGRVDAGKQQAKLHEVAAIEWEVHDLLPVYNGTHGRLLSLQQGRLTGHLDHLRYV